MEESVAHIVENQLHINNTHIKQLHTKNTQRGANYTHKEIESSQGILTMMN
jgi:CxxC motif-containing protein